MNRLKLAFLSTPSGTVNIHSQLTKAIQGINNMESTLNNKIKMTIIRKYSNINVSIYG